MSNSPLVSFTQISPCKNSPRTQKIERFTPHVYVGQVSVERMGKGWQNKNGQTSANYGIGSDGRIGLYVDEKDRAWTSSSKDNDMRAITVECASDTKAPYKINDEVWNSLVNLLEDICRRNGKTKVLWFGDKEKSLSYKPASNEIVITVHRWFASKSCPGEYLYGRLGELADTVNNRLATVKEPVEEETQFWQVVCGSFKDLNNAKARAQSLRSAGYECFIQGRVQE